MSIQIASQTNTGSTATTKVAGDKKVSSNLASGQSTSETVCVSRLRLSAHHLGAQGTGPFHQSQACSQSHAGEQYACASPAQVQACCRL